MKSTIKYKRVLLKMSGEGFGSENWRGIKKENFIALAKEIQKVPATGSNGSDGDFLEYGK